MLSSFFQSNKKFVWNHSLVKVFRDTPDADMFCIPIIYGSELPLNLFLKSLILFPFQTLA